MERVHRAIYCMKSFSHRQAWYSLGSSLHARFASIHRDADFSVIEFDHTKVFKVI
jgi:hypothetical protein